MESNSLDMQIDELLENSSSNWFLNESAAHQNALPEGVEIFMNKAMSDQYGSALDFKTLIGNRNQFQDDQEGQERDVDDDMLQMDLALPQEDLALFKDMPNFNARTTLQAKAKKWKKNRVKQVFNILIQDVAYPALPQELNLLMQRANGEYVNGNNVQAISTLKEVIKNRPDADDAWVSLAMVYMSQKDYHKAAQCKMMAAHLSPRNNSLWKDVGILLKQLGDDDQAIYCFKNAATANPDDLECHFELTTLYEEKGLQEAAQDAYETVLNFSPLNKRAIKSLARIYMGKSMIYDAIGLFQKLFYADEIQPLTDSFKNDFHDEVAINMANIKPQRMGFEELYMFLELHLEIRLYETGLEYVETGIRRLLGLPGDYSIRNSSLYDDYYSAVPLQLVVKLGVCLLHLGDETSSIFLISKLYEIPPHEYVDSYFEVGEAHFEKKQYLLALQVFKTLDNENLGDQRLVQSKLGDCYMRLGVLEKALECFQVVLKLSPGDSKIQTQIIFILEALGEESKALELQKRFVREKEMLNQELDIVDQSNVISSSKQPLFNDDFNRKKRFAVDKRQKDRENAARNSENVKDKLALDLLAASPETIVSKMEYIVLGKKLLANFKSNSKVSSKNNDRDGLVLPKGVKDETLIYPYWSEKLRNVFAGLAASEWIDLIVNLARTFALDGKGFESYSAMKILHDSSITQNEDRLKINLQLAMLSFALASKNYERVNVLIRYFCFEGPYFIEGLRLFSLVFGGGDSALSFYSLSSNQKYLGRILEKVMKTKIEDPQKYSNQDYSHVFNTFANWSFVSRSYPIAIQYYLMAKSLYCENVEINLYLAMAYFHRASHKLESRHMHALKGIAFLFEYRSKSLQSYQSSYNVGRAFHLLSLYYLAIPFYEHALEDPSSEYARECAYNLAMIYTVIGSPHLAQAILKQYWTIQ